MRAICLVMAGGSRSAIGLFVATLAAAVLAACSAGPERNWIKDGTDTSSAADLEACRAYARAEVKVQSDIDQDIAASSTDPFGPAMSGTTNYSAAGTDRRYRQILDQCMQDLGYRVAP